MKSDIPHGLDTGSLKECLRMARMEPDEDVIRRYFFVHVKGSGRYEPLSESELRWVRLNVEHHPRWRSYYRGLVTSYHRSRPRSRPHTWMQLAILILLLIPAGLDVVKRSDRANMTSTVEAAQEALVDTGEATALVPPGTSGSTAYTYNRFGRSWRAARLAPDLDTAAALWRGLMSRYSGATESTLKAETAYLLGGLAEAFNDTTAAVLWYRRSLSENTTKYRTGALESLEEISKRSAAD